MTGVRKVAFREHIPRADLNNAELPNAIRQNSQSTPSLGKLAVAWLARPLGHPNKTKAQTPAIASQQE